jgi:hypothetical protein
MTRLEFINFIKSTKLIYATVSYNEFNEHMDVFEGRQELSPFTKDLEEVLIFKNNRGNIKITIQHRSVLKKNDLNELELRNLVYITQKYYEYKDLTITYMLNVKLMVKNKHKIFTLYYKDYKISNRKLKVIEHNKVIDFEFSKNKKLVKRTTFNHIDEKTTIYNVPSYVVVIDTVIKAISFIINGKSQMFLEDEIDFLDDNFKSDPFTNELSLTSQNLLSIITY